MRPWKVPRSCGRRARRRFGCPRMPDSSSAGASWLTERFKSPTHRDSDTPGGRSERSTCRWSGDHAIREDLRRVGVAKPEGLDDKVSQTRVGELRYPVKAAEPAVEDWSSLVVWEAAQSRPDDLGTSFRQFCQRLRRGHKPRGARAPRERLFAFRSERQRAWRSRPTSRRRTRLAVRSERQRARRSRPSTTPLRGGGDGTRGAAGEADQVSVAADARIGRRAAVTPTRR